jgi:hypothetical protein
MVGVFNQAITLWSKSTRDVYGQLSYGSPQALLGRWQDKAELIIGADGQEVKARSIVYLSGNIAINTDDKILIGTSVSATPTTTANNVLMVEKMKSIDNVDLITKVYV